jgi:hypothetical protein
MHLRGPMNVSQIAVYELASTISKQDNQDPSFLDQTVPSDFDAAVEQFKKSSGQPRIQDSDDDFQARSNDRFVRRTYPSLLPPPPAIGGGAPNPSAQLCATPCVKTVTTTVFVTAAHCKPCHPNNEQTPIVVSTLGSRLMGVRKKIHHSSRRATI